MHPHKDMEIISIPLRGKLMHRDDLGNEVTIGEGEVQVMSAGSGVTHSEMNPSAVIDGEFLQIWIQTREIGSAPFHAHGMFPLIDQRERFVTLVRPDSVKGFGLPIAQDAYISRGNFFETKSVTYRLKRQGSGMYVFLLHGSVSIDSDILDARDALGVWETEQISIEILSPADILIIEVPME
jgi:redox-sensitive bicupin YhaK (pirin superfamily)